MRTSSKKLCRLTPFLTVTDLNKAISFYEKAFGFKLVGEPLKDDKGQIVQVAMNYKDADIWLRPESSGTNSKAPATLKAESPVWICITCDSDLEMLFKQAVNAGAKIVHEPHERYGLRFFKVFDQDGHSWSFHQELS